MATYNTSPRSSVEIFGICTGDQPSALGLSLPGFASNLRHFGHSSCKVLVVDDSKSRQNRELNHALVLKTRAAMPELSIAYVDHTGRRKLVAELARSTGMPRELLSFALLHKSGSRTVGSARNVAHLLSASRQAVFSDDDTLPLWVADSSEDSNSASVSNAPPFFNSIFHENTADAWSTVKSSAISLDLCNLHGSVLGRPVSELVKGSLPSGPAELLTTRVGHHYDSDRAVVSLSSTGTAGDSGKWTSVGMLVMPDEATLTSLWSTAASYKAAGHSRLIRRIPTHLQISRSTLLQTMSYGVDLRRLHPPFVPFGRNSDGIFALFNRLINTDTYIAHIPAAILHLPRIGKPYDVPYKDAMLYLRIADWIGMLLKEAASRQFLEPETAMAEIGANLRAASSLNDEQFAQKIIGLISQHRVMQLDGIYSVLSKYEGIKCWREDLLEIMQKITTCPFTAESLIPLELGGMTWVETIEFMREFVRQYGELISAWPELVGSCLSNQINELFGC